MIKLKFSKLAELLGLENTFGEGEFTGIAMDSHAVKPGNLFLAIEGEQVDGHEYLVSVFSKGAAVALVTKAVSLDKPCFLVEDIISAVQVLAIYWRNQFDIPFIGLTGSNGKTTTKNMIANILQKACHDDPNQRLSTFGNWNTQLATPLMLCQLNENHRYAVIEMGMDGFGQISKLTHMVKPNVALILNALPSHLEFVGSLAGVAKAKGEIFEGLQQNGMAIINADSDFKDYWETLAEKNKIQTFGIDHKANIKAEDINITTQGSVFTLKTPNDSIEINLPLLGKHNIMNALGAAASCLAVGILLEHIKTGLESIKPEVQRLQEKVTKEGVYVLDDSYNANPASLKAAIDVLVLYQGKKYLALGDMKELGPTEKALHYEVGQYAKEVGVDYLFAVGELTLESIKGFGDHAKHFENKKELVTALRPLLHKGDCVLAKGSHFSMHMEEIVEALLGSQDPVTAGFD